MTVHNESCGGRDCVLCRTVCREGWTCTLGTLPADAFATYFAWLRDKAIVPRGFWQGPAAHTNLSLFLRYGVTHLLGMTGRDEIRRAATMATIRALGLTGAMRLASHQVFAAFDSAFPEHDFMPWELPRVPRNFWTSHAEQAAVRWFLARQDWTPERCLDLVQSNAGIVYAALKECGLRHLAWQLRLHRVLADLQHGADSRGKRDLLHSGVVRRRARASIVCPLCSRCVRHLIAHTNHKHPATSRDDVMRLIGTDGLMQTPELYRQRSKQSRATRQRLRPPPRLIRRGVMVPIEYWPFEVKWVQCTMNEWSSSLLLSPSAAEPRGDGTSLRVSIVERTSHCLSFHPALIRAVLSDCRIVPGPNATIAMMLTSEQARAAVWQWYQWRRQPKRTAFPL